LFSAKQAGLPLLVIGITGSFLVNIILSGKYSGKIIQIIDPSARFFLALHF
jgi:hypothetical protein